MASALVPEARIEQEDAAKLAQALAAVNAHYATVFNPKIVAWVNLASVGAGIYGPRVLAYGIRKKSERKPRTVAPVTPIRPVAPVAPTPMQPNAGSANTAAPVVPKMPPRDPALADASLIPDLEF